MHICPCPRVHNCAHLCILVHICPCPRVHSCAQFCTFVHAQLSTSVHNYAHLCTFVQALLYTFVHEYVATFVHIRICTAVHKYRVLHVWACPIVKVCAQLFTNACPTVHKPTLWPWSSLAMATIPPTYIVPPRWFNFRNSLVADSLCGMGIVFFWGDNDILAVLNMSHQPEGHHLDDRTAPQIHQNKHAKTKKNEKREHARRRTTDSQ